MNLQPTNQDDLSMSAGKDKKLCGESEVTSGSKVATNTLVVGRVLQFLDWEDLLNCRLVSQLWNDEVVHTFLQIPKFHQNKDWVFDRYPKFVFDLGDYGNRIERDEKLTDSCCLLQKSKHPKFLVDRANIEYGEVFKASPRAVVQCQQILHKSGNYITKLEITVDGKMDLLSRCLGHKGYCPNLQHLYIHYCYEIDQPFTKLDVQDLGILKLKELKIACYSKSNENLLELFKTFLDHSPLISNLSLEYVSLSPFLQVLQSKPEITMRLTELNLVWCDEYDNFQNLCLLKFGSSLKRIEVTHRCTSYCEFGKLPESHEEGFKKFLKIISHSLESLKVDIGCSPECVSVADIPFMPKLRKLTFAHTKYHRPINLNAIKNLPSLRILKMHSLTPTIFKLLETTWRESARSPKGKSSTLVPREIHGRLESINLGDSLGQIIYRPKTMEYLNVAFPYLSRLTFRPQLPISMKAKQQNGWFHQCFFLISQMKHLKNLSISFDRWKYHEFGMDLKKPFAVLKKTPNLLEITLRVQTNNKFKANLIGIALPALMGAPKLRLIQFHCHEVDIDTQMVNDFAKMKINLKVVGNWNCCQNHLWLRQGMVGIDISPEKTCWVHHRMWKIDVKLGTIDCPRTFQSLNIAFPNLSKLKVYVEPPAGMSPEETETWFSESFNCISKMQRLTDLTIDFEHWKCNQFCVDLKKAFFFLKSTANLTKLTLYGWDEGIDEEETLIKAHSIISSLQTLIGNPNLRRIGLYIARLGPPVNENLKMRILQLRTYFLYHWIFLHVDF